MKKLLLAILFTPFFMASQGQQSPYWQQQVNMQMKVTLNDRNQSLDADVQMEYINNSPDTLHFIWMHLWPNAYKNDRTAFSDQLLENGRTDFYFSKEEDKGYVNRLAFKVNNENASTQDHPQHQDIVKLLLPSPLPPAGKAIITTPFHVKLPKYFSRSGHINQFFTVTQWYPKPAVYDNKGWHPMPYLDQGEFYNNFGDYKVSITVPADYDVAATGERTDSSSSDSSKTLTYAQDNILDFAWFAGKNFEVLHDTLQLDSKVINVYAYYNPANRAYWTNSIAYMKSAIISKSKWLGEYPYRVATVVENAVEPNGGGMEYPTITLVSTMTDEKMLDYLVNHEIGHNWFYGILASNERAYPWLDEGMNSYYDQRYFRQQYGQSEPDFFGGTSKFIEKRRPIAVQKLTLAAITAVEKDQPIITRAEDFTEINYSAIAYTKAAQWMQLLEQELGTLLFDSVMRSYYRAYAFKHPEPQDFKNIAETISGKPLDHLFARLHTKGSLEAPQKKDIKVTSFFSLRDTDKHDYIFVAPAVGYNFYDKFMLGAFVHNYSLPATRLQFFAAPLYATGSKALNGIARMAYSWFPGSKGAKAELAIAGARFNADSFTDSTGKINYQPFTKLAPSLKFTFANRHARSTVTKFLQFKTFLISETGLRFTRDTINDIDVITYPKEDRILNQLQFVLENNRVLYPFNAAFQLEQGDGFLRTNFTGNYFFNYANGGGANVRLFAGKFFYTGDRTFLTQFETDRYHLNMTGPKGYEDYTYNNYFFGRNEFDGFANQQIMMRDGAFKVRTDLLSSKIGKTDDWLAAMNFTSSIPKAVNPLSILPFQLPLKVFADIGTYAQAWEKNAGTPRFLFDAGIQLSLLKNTVNVYVPLLYSKVYSDYFKSTITEQRFLKNISFSVDLQNATLKKLFPQIPF